MEILEEIHMDNYHNEEMEMNTHQIKKNLIGNLMGKNEYRKEVIILLIKFNILNKNLFIN